MIERQRLRDTATTLGIALIGAAIFAALGFPAPFLTGPALAVTLAGLAGVQVSVPTRLRDACFVVLGISIGSNVTPKILESILTWPFSFAVMAVSLVAIIIASKQVLGRGFGFDPRSAFLASVPGHLSYVLGLGAQEGVDLARISLVQSIRVLFLTLLVPAALGLSGAVNSAPGPVIQILPIYTIVALTLATIALGLIFQRVALPAAFLLAGIAVTATAELTQTISGTIPGWLNVAAFTVLGALIGTRFRGRSFADLRSGLGAGLAGTLIAVAIASVGAIITAQVLDLPINMLLIAFAPGGLEAMAAMAVQVNADPTFVAAHHVTRLLMLTVLIPVMFRRL